MLPASLIAAAGMSLAFIPSLGTAISAAKPEEGGLASGIVNTSYQVGSALGLAVMTAIATSQGADQLGNVASLTDGYSAAFLGAAGVGRRRRTPHRASTARPEGHALPTRRRASRSPPNPSLTWSAAARRRPRCSARTPPMPRSLIAW